MKLICLIAAVASGVMGLMASAAPASSQWDQPAAALAEQIAGILGPGQAHLTIRNLSTISTDEIPAIRRLLEQDLKARGVTTAEAEDANLLRVTLSENVRERLWVAEIVEGNETRVAMVHVDLKVDSPPPMQTGILLRSKRIWDSSHRSNCQAHRILFATDRNDCAAAPSAPRRHRRSSNAPLMAGSAVAALLMAHSTL